MPEQSTGQAHKFRRAGFPRAESMRHPQRGILSIGSKSHGQVLGGWAFKPWNVGAVNGAFAGFKGNGQSVVCKSLTGH